MCSGASDGSIRVWGGATLEHRCTLRDEEDARSTLTVLYLAAWERNLISGHNDGAYDAVLQFCLHPGVECGDWGLLSEVRRAY